MTRNDLKQLARIRIEEAQVLFNNKNYSEAYYLAGYSIECALKACIAKQIRKFDFPDKHLANDSYTHDIEKLLKVAGLFSLHKQECDSNPNFKTNWEVVKDWSEKSRYQKFDKNAAKDLYLSIIDQTNGILPWLEQHW
jgi:AbiV family abortive infection protein